MERIVAPNGSQINLESLVDSIQEKAFNNFKKRLEEVFGTLGLTLTSTNGALGSEFSLSLTSSNTLVTVAEGKALTSALSYIKIASPISTSNLTIANPNKGYGIVLTYAETSSSPVKAVNAFVYDKLGSTASLNRKTVYADSVTVSLVEITSNLTALRASLTTEQILIGAVWNSSGTFNTTTAGLSGYTPTNYATYRVVDLRSEVRGLFNPNLLSDSVVLFKDRPSTGSAKFNQNIEFGQNVDISGSLTFSSGVDYTLTPATNKVEVASSTGTHMELYQEGGEAKVKINKLVSDGTIKVLSAGQYRDVVISGPPSTTPRNLRIFDIYPTEDPNENSGYIEVRWNWDELNMTAVTSTTISIAKTSYVNESVDFNTDDRNTYLPGKKIYFPSSGNSYSIVSVVDGGSSWVFTVSGNPSAETSNSSLPLVICDSNAEYYRLKFVSYAQQGRKTRETKSFELGEEYVISPSFVTKLELSRQWYCTIQGINNTHMGSVITMAAGSYDPDHTGGGQPVINYGSPFLMELPNLASSGEASLEADAQGFNISISGWTGLDNQTTAHEFEVLWSETKNLNSSSFLDPAGDAAQRMIIGASKKAHISSGIPTRYSVGVRPLQNKQPVGTPLFYSVVSGGGGALPTEVTLVDENVDLNVTYLRKYYDDPSLLNSGPTGNAHVVSSLGMLSGGQEYIDPRALGGKQVVVPTDSGNLFYGLGTLTVTQPAANGTVAIPSPSAPRPTVLAWTSTSASSPTGTYATESTWGKATFVPTSAAGVYETVAAGASVEFTGSICFPNVAKTEARIKLVNNDTNAVLKTITVKKDTFYPPSNDEFTHRVSVSWINNTLAAVKVRVEIYIWGDFGSYAPADLTFAVMFIDFHVGFQVGHYSLGTFSGYNLPVNFGKTLPTIYKISDALTDGSSHSTIVYSKFYGHYSAGPGFLYAVKIIPDPGLISGNTLVLGATKASRAITEKKLSVEYEITRMDFVCTQTENVSQSNPAYIRIYPADSEGSAAFLEVPSTGTLTAENLRLLIKRDVNSEIKFKVDAYDPSPSGTNNFTEISGKLTVRGKPIISNKLV